MKLGVLSISLTVKNLQQSKLFYETLGFKVFAGDLEKNYLIMKNDDSLIGLFYGMFDSNIITFNPGWDSNANVLEDFDDVRSIQERLIDKGIKPISEIEGSTGGPANFMITDPDGNVILIDQHV